MAFAPASTIWLCNVPFDNSYKHVVYFASRSGQQSYFAGKVVKTYSEYVTIRKNLPGGGIRSSVKVGENIDTLRSLPCNYMYYQNANHGTRIYYAFITEFIYINEDTTEIVFETDVFQTWFPDAKIQKSFVVREHSETDEIGGNIVPESFEFGDYVYATVGGPFSNVPWGYLICTSEPPIASMSRGLNHSGIYQGLYFCYSESPAGVNAILDELNESGSDCIVSITAIPRFCISASLGSAGNIKDTYIVSTSSEPALENFTINMDSYSFTFGGYSPKNKKLYTSPYMKLVATNHTGEVVEYAIEDFSDRNAIKFKVYGDVSTTPSVFMFPTNYKGIANNVDEGIKMADFPQCAFNNDTFKLWMNKNFTPMLINNTGSFAGAMVMGAGAGGPIGGAMAATSAISGITNVISETLRMKKEPNQAHIGAPKNNLLTAMKRNNINVYCRMIKKVYAQTIDDYFTMFGYQTNRVKIPNLYSRPYFNYVQTVDMNIYGGIPTDDLARLKQIFNDGVTLWHSHATIGDYSVDNSPNGGNG